MYCLLLFTGVRREIVDRQKSFETAEAEVSDGQNIQDQ